MRVATVTGTALALWLAGCGGDDGPPAPKSGGPTSLPATPAPPAAAPAPAPAAGGPAPAAPAAGARTTVRGGLSFAPPATWTSTPPSSAPRQAQYTWPKAAADADAPELVVYYFGPGQGGDVDANLQRWAGQFKSATGAPATPAIARRNVNGLTVHTLDVSGTYVAATMPGAPEHHNDSGQRMLAAIIVAPDGDRWFFKCVGPVASVAQGADGFRALCDSVQRSR